MEVKSFIKYKETGWCKKSKECKHLKNPLVLVFGDRLLLEVDGVYEEIREFFTNPNIVLGSSYGSVCCGESNSNDIVVTAIEFERATYEIRTNNIFDFDKDSFQVGKDLMLSMPKKDLKHVFVLSEGSFVNASSLLDGFEKGKTEAYTLTGALCADDLRFEKTISGYNSKPTTGQIVAIGFYGESLEVSYSSYGGWTPFGPERNITKSNNNKVYEIDGVPALDMYKKFLGEKASLLPDISMTFPIQIKMNDKEEALVRTVIMVNEEEKSITLAGNVSEGAKLQMIMGFGDSIIRGATTAAIQSTEHRKQKAELVLMVSCAGRKVVMQERIEEEVEALIDVIGEETPLVGMYSYGEMAPFKGSTGCELHNHTMTLTLLSE